MHEHTVIGVTRRSYEFGLDRIRLSAVSAPEIQLAIKSTFKFESAITAPPPATFGYVPETAPPGAVFNNGTIGDETGTLTPIRFIHFEPTRLVVDVAGPSEAIDSVYAQLRGVLDAIRLSTGEILAPEPHSILDYSELIRHMDVAPEFLLPPSIRPILTSAVEVGPATSMGPVLAAGPARLGAEFQGSFYGYYSLQLRTGTKPEEHVYWSVAPLTTAEHADYLDRIEQALVSDVTSGPKPRRRVSHLIDAP